MHSDGLFFLKALVEVLTLEHLRNRELGGEANEIFRGEFRKPAAIEIDDGLLWIEDFEDLGFVGFGVLVDLVAGEWRTRGGAAGGVSDHAGKVADQKDDRVSEILEVLELAQHHGVTEVQIGRGRVKT